MLFMVLVFKTNHIQNIQTHPPINSISTISEKHNKCNIMYSKLHQYNVEYGK